MGALIIFGTGLFSLGLVVGVQFGRWSAFLFPRRDGQQLRQLANARSLGQVPRADPHGQVKHAGYYVQQLRSEGRRAGWSQLEPPESFARVR